MQGVLVLIMDAITKDYPCTKPFADSISKPPLLVSSQFDHLRALSSSLGLSVNSFMSEKHCQKEKRERNKAAKKGGKTLFRAKSCFRFNKNFAILVDFDGS